MTLSTWPFSYRTFLTQNTFCPRLSEKAVSNFHVIKILKCAFVFILATNLACQKKTDDAAEGVDDNPAKTAESAMAEVGGWSNAFEGDSASLMSDDSSLSPLAACTYAGVVGACSSTVRTGNWNGCTITAGLITITMTGQWTDTFSASGACSANSLIGATNGDYFTRKTVAGSPQVATFGSGATLTTDTDGGTTYAGDSIGSGGIKITKSNTGERTISQGGSGGGVHKVLKGPRGTTWFDYYVVPTNIVVSGTKAAGTRTISGGTMTIYHNRAQYIATHSYSSVLWGSSSCCYPTSGSISSSFTGSVTGSSTLTFGSTCGSATFDNQTSSGTQGSTTFTLTNCQ